MSQNDLSQFDPEFIEEKHPRHRAIEEDDPMQLNADAVFGDPEVMLESLIEEYARMGQTAGQIAEGVNAGALGEGISKNIDSFTKSMGREGLLHFNQALKKSGKRYYFLEGLGKSSSVYLQALK